MDIIGIRKERWKNFYSSTKNYKTIFQIDIEDGVSRPFPNRQNVNDRIEWALRKYEQYISNQHQFDDDRIPCLHVYSGTEIFAEVFGCNIHRPVDNMPFALPCVHNAREAASLKIPEIGESTLALLFEIADILKQKAGNDAILQIPDVQSPLDIAAMIWEKSDFYVALLEEKEAVFDLLHKIQSLLITFFKLWFTRYGTEYIAHYPYYYMVGGITLSEDEIGVIDNEMFDEFAMPDLEHLASVFGGIGIHCCAKARHQWPNLKKIPGLKLLNLVQPKKEIQDAYTYFENHTCQMHSWSGEGEAWTWPAQHPANARIVYTVQASSLDEAKYISERFRDVIK